MRVAVAYGILRNVGARSWAAEAGAEAQADIEAIDDTMPHYRRKKNRV